MRVAATQLLLAQGDVEGNCERAIRLVRLAARERAEVVVLPEFFTSGVAIDDGMLAVPRLNREARVLERLRAEARGLGIIISGSMLCIWDADVYNSMVVVHPDGSTFVHDKDLPTQFENAYYAPGDERRTDGAFALALCWELLRRKTVAEIGPSARLVLAGSCWWSLPVGTSNQELDAYNDELNASTPAAFATAAGLPVVHASLVGRIRTRRTLARDEVVERRLVGTTQIVDRYGRVVASIRDKGSDDLIVEDVELAPRGSRRDPGAGFWLATMRDEYLRAWETEGRLGRELYDVNRARMLGTYPDPRSAARPGSISSPRPPAVPASWPGTS